MGETALETPMFRREERVGLLVALALHVAVVAVLLFQPVRDEAMSIPERMTVSLASEVSLESTAPDPAAESRAAIAPTLADEPVPATETPDATPDPATAAPDRPTPAPRTERPSQTRPNAAPSPRQTPSGGNRIGSDFLPGSGNSTRTDDTRIPASEIGPSAQASIVQAIVRQIRPHWNAPSGADAERLVSVLAFELNEDGSLKGRPRVTNQSGITDSNRPQAPLHAERAIRAVQLAAPFDLPDEYYDAWKSIRGARFDRNLSR